MAAAFALALCDPSAKCKAVERLKIAAAGGELSVEPLAVVEMGSEPGRPAHPTLVHPSRVARRRLGTLTGRIALLHALAHIEFNAINLALDAAARFPGLPEQYYYDWIKVAGEEAYHFSLLCERLAAVDQTYGALSAHDGLWEVAEKTRHDVLARMAVVPRVLEARGLDVTPGLQNRLRAVGDEATVAVLEVIFQDEIRHVAIGNHWFYFLCRTRSLDPRATFLTFCADLGISTPHPPFNMPARKAAGFDADELIALEK